MDNEFSDAPLSTTSFGSPDPADARTPAEIFEAERAAQIRRGTMRLARGLRSARPAGSLSGNQLSVLSLLHRGGPRTPTDIAAVERQQPQSLTRTFADLERNGLVRRTQSEEDRRRHLLEITPEGRHALGADMAVRDAWLTARLAGLTETERELLRLAGTLMERIADPGGAPSAVRNPEE
jgi:DNA-binding MarR family transcriptional regulator